MADNLAFQQHKDRLQALSKLDYNYDEKVYHATQDKKGWNVDRYVAHLAIEEPGMPEPNGAFEQVKVAIRLYQFPDPKLITAVFDPEGELPGRNMLLLAHFMGLQFEFGVRVSAVIDELRKTPTGENLQVWGYSYRTLKGHFEVGEIRFEVSKNLGTGDISFEIDAYSKPDRIPNIFFRVGFKVFGRTLQRYFAKSSMHRLQRIAQKATKSKRPEVAAAVPAGKPQTAP